MAKKSQKKKWVSPRPTKSINVTEARANLSSLLNENNLDVIVTKNNKPKKVLIEFETYQRFCDGVQNSQERPITKAKLEDFERETQKESGAIKKQPIALPKNDSHLKGLLASRMQYLEPSEGDLEVEEERVATTPVVSPESSLDVGVAEAYENLEENYFGGEDQDYLMDDMVDPEELTDQDFETAQQVLESESGVLLGSEDQNLEDSLSFEGDGEGALDEHLTLDGDDLEEDSLENEEAETENLAQDFYLNKSPEEIEYYKRYRKLYEQLDSQAKPSRNRRLIEKSPSKATIESSEEASLEDIKKDALREFNREYFDEGTTEQPDPVPTQDLSEFDDDDFLAVGEEGGLPSLQDLLQDLDDEKLTNEKSDELNEKEIDDLISRITSD